MHSEKILYDYIFTPGKDGFYTGRIVLDSTDDFSLKSFKEVNENSFNVGQLAKYSDENKIQILDLKTGEIKFVNLNSSKLKAEKIEGTDLVKILGYGNRSSVKFYSYSYETLIETKDEIIFLDVQKEGDLDVKYDTITIRKGPIYVQEKDKMILRLEVQMLGVTKQNEYEGRRLFFKPKNETLASEISNYGIFKEVKKRNQKDS
jgi:hypothetical protein